jgi:hypothetical protein
MHSACAGAPSARERTFAQLDAQTGYEINGRSMHLEGVRLAVDTISGVRVPWTPTRDSVSRAAAAPR